MTQEDLKLHIWYQSDNGWNQVYILGVDKNKWIIYDPESSGILSIDSNIQDDEFEEVEKQDLVYQDIIKDIFTGKIDVML